MNSMSSAKSLVFGVGAVLCMMDTEGAATLAAEARFLSDAPHVQRGMARPRWKTGERQIDAHDDSERSTPCPAGCRALVQRAGSAIRDCSPRLSHAHGDQNKVTHG